MPDQIDLRAYRREVPFLDAWRDWDGFVTLEGEEVAAAPKVSLVDPSSVAPRDFADDHCVVGRVQSIGCHFLRDVTYAGMLYPFSEGRLLNDGSHLSRVSADWLDLYPQHRPGGTENRPPIRISDPVVAVVGPGHQTFGHWIIDFLPRLAVGRALLKERFSELRFLVLTDTPEWGKDLLAKFFDIGPDRLIHFEFAKDEFVCERVCYPTFPHTYPFFLHSFLERFYRSVYNGPFGDRRLCVQRRSSQSGRNFLRRAEFEQRAREEGFELVDPQTLPIETQAELFSSAGVIIGEYGSALHNCVFSSGSTRVGVLNAPGVEQTRLCAVLGQPIVYVVGQADGESWSLTDEQMDRFFATLRPIDAASAESSRSDRLGERMRERQWRLWDQAGSLNPATISFHDGGRVTGCPDIEDARWSILHGNIVLAGVAGTGLLSFNERLDFGDEILLWARSQDSGVVVHLDSLREAREPEWEVPIDTHDGISNPCGLALTIGKFCSIASEVAIVAQDYDTRRITTYRLPGTAMPPSDGPAQSVTIGNDVRIERGVIIRAGAEIGDGVVVFAGSVVRGRLPPYALVEGNPAHVVGFRFGPDQIARLSVLKWWNWPTRRLARLRPLLDSQDIDGFLAAAERQ